MVALVLLPGLDGTGLLLADFAASFGPEVKVIVASYPKDIPLAILSWNPSLVRFSRSTNRFFFSLSPSQGLSASLSPPRRHPASLGWCCVARSRAARRLGWRHCVR